MTPQTPQPDELRRLLARGTHRNGFDINKVHAAITKYIEDVVIGPNEKIELLEKPGHGPCCTCQQCGLSYDDCGCGDKRKRNAFRAEQRAQLHNGREGE